MMDNKTHDFIDFIMEHRRQLWLKGVREYLAKQKAEKANGTATKIAPLPFPDRKLK